MWEKNKSNYKIKPWVNCVSVNNTINSLCLFEVHAWLIVPVCLHSPLSHQVFGTWGKCTQLIMTLHSAVYLCVWSKVEKYNQRDVMWFESLWTVAHVERWSYVSVEIASKPEVRGSIHLLCVYRCKLWLTLLMHMSRYSLPCVAVSLIVQLSLPSCTLWPQEGTKTIRQECVKSRPMAGGRVSGQPARPHLGNSLLCCPRGNMSQHHPLWTAERSINKEWLNSPKKKSPSSTVAVELNKPFSLQLPLASCYFETRCLVLPPPSGICENY